MLRVTWPRRPDLGIGSLGAASASANGMENGVFVRAVEIEDDDVSIGVFPSLFSLAHVVLWPQVPHRQGGHRLIAFALV